MTARTIVKRLKAQRTRTLREIVRKVERKPQRLRPLADQLIATIAISIIDKRRSR